MMWAFTLAEGLLFYRLPFVVAAMDFKKTEK